MFGIGMTELLVILVVGLLVLGPKRLPELARSLGRGLAEFRRASTDMRREFLDVTEEVRREESPDDFTPGAGDVAEPSPALTESPEPETAAPELDPAEEPAEEPAETKGG